MRLGLQRRAYPDLRVVRRAASELLPHVPRTQELEPVYAETSAFFVFGRDVWCKHHRRIGEHPYVAVTDRIESTDIDNPDDFTLAEAIVAAGLNK